MSTHHVLPSVFTTFLSKSRDLSQLIMLIGNTFTAKNADALLKVKVFGMSKVRNQ